MHAVLLARARSLISAPSPHPSSQPTSPLPRLTAATPAASSQTAAWWAWTNPSCGPTPRQAAAACCRLPPAMPARPGPCCSCMRSQQAHGEPRCRHATSRPQPCPSPARQLVIKTCHKRGVHAIGGMSALIPVKGDARANEASPHAAMPAHMCSRRHALPRLCHHRRPCQGTAAQPACHLADRATPAIWPCAPAGRL